MAKLDEAPLVELADIFADEQHSSGPDGTLNKSVQSQQAQEPPLSLNTNDNNSSPNAQPVLYTPLHPSNIKSPPRRGRPPKNANNFTSQLASAPAPTSEQAPNINPQRAYNTRTRNIPPTLNQLSSTIRNPQPVANPPINQRWMMPPTRFGGLPNFHTSLGNANHQPNSRPYEFASMAQTSQFLLDSLPTSAQFPSMTAYSPRIPNILTNNPPSQPAHRVYKPPSDRAFVVRTTQAPAPAHTPQPPIAQHQPQIRTFNRNMRTNSYQFIPQAVPVRPAQEDAMRQLSSIAPNLDINNLLQRILTGQALPMQTEVDQNAVNEIKRQLEESLMSFSVQNSVPSMAGTLPTPHTKPLDLNSLKHHQANQPIPEQRKLPTEDDISKQDNDAEANQDEEYHEAETYSDYTPSKLQIGLPHPDPVVETSSLASVLPPDVTYKLKLPKNVIDDCLLSALQLESVVYACQQHEQFLPDGKTRRGFLIGDGAGVGKGRTIAGIIYENFLAGRKKSVWLSVSPDLKLDAERDLIDLGAKQIPVHFMTKHSYGKKIDVPCGVIFSTYTGLVSKSQSIRGPLGTRLGQLITWLGPKFDGVIVFDECHKAKNISLTAKQKQSKTADFALEFQNKLPGARIVYASATGASETRHLGYMTRLGLWGEGTPYDEFPEFCSAIEKRGVGAMELVAVELKMRGSYMARQLSFKTTSFDIRIAQLDENFIKLYDRCVELWSRTLQMFTEACKFFGSDQKKVKKISMPFWAAHQKFFKYLCIGAKVPLVVQIAKEALKDRKCVVIGLQSTGEAKTLEALDEGDLNEFVSTARATYESLIDNYFPAPQKPRVRAEAPAKSEPQSVSEPQDVQELSTDLSSTTVIDETFHSHEVVKFCVENGLASAKLEEDKAARELEQSSSRINSMEREEFKKRKLLLEELAKNLKKSPQKRGRSLRARKRAQARNTRQSRIKKPIDESETEISTPTSSSSSNTTNPSPESTDDTYSASASGDTDTESTLKNSDYEDEEADSSPVHTKRARISPNKKNEILRSDSDSDIEITAVKPRQRRCEIITLSSDDDDDDYEDVGSTDKDSSDPMLAHGDKLSAMRDELYKMIDDIGPDLPHNTLDDLIDQLGGPDCVAEMTGRKGRVVKDEDGLISYRQRNETDALESLNIAEKERFMKGDKLVAIISEAASSGISLQADRRAGNQLRRVHITIELPWSADRAIQQFGRTHRSNQVSGPEYVFVISGLAGEQRFASVVAKRLESLGALTHGDRRATTESRDLSQFNLSGRFCRQAIEQIVKYMEYRQNDMHITPDYDGDFLLDAKQAFLDTGLAKKSFGDRVSMEPAILNVNIFLNRLLGMRVRIQNALFKLFTDYMDRLIARKKISGQYDTGILELNSESGKTTCFPPDDYYLKTKAGIVKCTLHHVQVERGISWDEVRKLYENSVNVNMDERSGFYIYTGPGNCRIVTLLLREPNSVDLFRSFKPNTGRGPKPLLFSLINKGRKCSADQAAHLWQRIYDFTAENCVHLCYFNSCKRREAKMSCDIGLRHSKYCILSGGILTAWPYLERKSAEITERVRIVRLRLDSHNRVIGPVIPQQFVHRVRQILSQGAKETVVF